MVVRGPDGAPDRLLGLYQPTTPLGRELKDVAAMTARVSIGVGECRRPPLVLACRDGLRVA